MTTFEEQLVETQNKINMINNLTTKRASIISLINEFSQEVENTSFVLSGLKGVMDDSDISIIMNEIVAKLNVKLAEVESEITKQIEAGV